MLVTVTVWLSLVVACLVISLTPGAGAINTMTNALNEGWRRSIWGIVGQQLALVVHVAIVAAGVGLLVARCPGSSRRSATSGRLISSSSASG